MGSKWRWVLFGLGFALVVALVSPFASSDPDGLERVANDQGFIERETSGWASKLPFASVFSGYALRGLAEPGVAKAMAGVAGTLVVFGVAWGTGVALRRRRPERPGSPR